jgi:hypothetical protein
MNCSRRDGPGFARRSAVAFAFVAALLLSNCNGKERGISPIIQAPAVELASQNQMRILNALAIDYNVSESGNSRWYEVSTAGFNYVDDECRLYFNELFFLNREKDQLKSGLAALGATAAAVMGVTGATTKSISIVAQAFGLGIVSTDLVAGTYLYQVPPATALGFVKELQIAYRNGIADRKAMINSPSAAYQAIQNYLSLCLPPTIEAKIGEHIAAARAVADPASSGPSFGLNVVTVPQVTRADIKNAILKGSDSTISGTVVQKRRGGLTETEQRMQISEIRDLQVALCVNPDGDLGGKGSKTRTNLLNALTAVKIKTLPPTDRIIDRTFATFLRNQYVTPRLEDPAALKILCDKTDFSLPK